VTIGGSLDALSWAAVTVGAAAMVAAIVAANPAAAEMQRVKDRIIWSESFGVDTTSSLLKLAC
jgi:hypothetical protein